MDNPMAPYVSLYEEYNGGLGVLVGNPPWKTRRPTILTTRVSSGD
jgi:hypothetical protein